MRQKKILKFEALSNVRQNNPGKKIVHCHGVFDILHAGHIAYFESAKKNGDVLVVTVTSDKFVNRGPGRPYFNSTIRANMLAALEIVDFVAISDHQLSTPAIELLKPDFYVKGPDYRNMEEDPTGGIYIEKKAIESVGGKLAFTDDEVCSSSSILNTYFPTWSDEQLATIEKIKKEGGIKTIEDVLKKIEQEDVLVVGESIIDTYVFCKPESISSKSPSVSAKFLFKEDYAGGSLAVANHLSDFAKSVSYLSTSGGEPLFNKLLNEKLDKRIDKTIIDLPNYTTPRKTRFIADDKVQRLLEITDLSVDQWKNNSPKEFSSLLLDKAAKSTCSIVCDFGHGMFENSVLNAITDIDSYIALNVQTNSSNYGFNPFTKHKKFSYMSIDLKEARVAFQDRIAAQKNLVERIKKQISKNTSFSMTLGPSGSYYFPSSCDVPLKSPAFSGAVIDALGAGDAYFALTSVLAKVDCPDVMIPFLGNIFAGLKTKIIGNKSSVSRAQLIKSVLSILK